MRPRIPWLSVFASLLVLLSAACAGADGVAGPGSTSTADDDVATRDAAQPGPAMSSPGAQQLDFVLPALGGGEVRGQTLVGEPVALWFWTPW